VSLDIDRRLERLEASRARVLASLDGFDAVALNSPPAPGQWSALQVLHHVVTTEALTLGYIRKKMQAGPALENAGVASRLRLLALEVALALPIRVKAPSAVAEVPRAVELAVLRARWDEVRRGLSELVRTFPAELEGRLVFRHPLAGRMTLGHALGTLQAHLGHHVRQVERALARARATNGEVRA
jgi:hypothetical protein